ncbi:hypothetical protein IMSAGC003_02196 [Lachnospiraceae bacterium]|nr:hypothetical protein [Lachnospiraceae bacterium]MCX4273036.1 hypothetical protein [Acetatifactor sp.]GFH95645.1 hypothetical protein IMSAGC003_02196 [Lachnospiraceae bacterium]
MKIFDFFKKIFTPKNRRKAQEGEWENLVNARAGVDFEQEEERSRYVTDCLEQIAEVSRELEMLQGEYSRVTAYLTDLEELEALPEQEKESLEIIARKLQNMEREYEDFTHRKNRMDDAVYYQFKNRETELEEGIEKIRKTENYGVLVKQDMQRLEGERLAYEYRKNELHGMMENLRGMAVIFLTALVICLGLLAALQFGLHMQTQVGYFIAVLAAALALTILAVKYMDADREMARVLRDARRLVKLQNKVKIRYVNNKNLLDYYYIKYDVDSGKKLEKLYHQYLEEKEQRKQFAETEARREYYHKQLLAQLGRYRIRYPDQLSGNVTVILDHREQVERRHELILRRQSLRKQMDYNNTVAGEAKQEIKDIVMAYPRYAAEITEMVDRYDSVYRS